MHFGWKFNLLKMLFLFLVFLLASWQWSWWVAIKVKMNLFFFNSTISLLKYLMFLCSVVIKIWVEICELLHSDLNDLLHNVPTFTAVVLLLVRCGAQSKHCSFTEESKPVAASSLSFWSIFFLFCSLLPQHHAGQPAAGHRLWPGGGEDFLSPFLERSQAPEHGGSVFVH